MKQSGEQTFYHVDGVGSVVTLSVSAGEVSERVELDGFGTPTFLYGDITRPVSSIGNPFVFHSRDWNPLIGMYHHRARHYDPLIGRFTQPDPAWQSSLSRNLYEAFRNSPQRFRDPLGLWYVDFNFSVGYGFGATFGWQVNHTGVYPYAGGGIFWPPGPGVAVTFSFDDPSPGKFWGIQVAGAPFAIQFGGEARKQRPGENKVSFIEYGFAPSGVSATALGVAGPFFGPPGSGSHFSSIRDFLLPKNPYGLVQAGDRRPAHTGKQVCFISEPGGGR